jgi:hypothetical protein
LDGGSARRKAHVYTQENTNRINEHTDIHAPSEIRTQDPKCSSGRKTVHDLDLEATDIGEKTIYLLKKNSLWMKNARGKFVDQYVQLFL